MLPARGPLRNSGGRLRFRRTRGTDEPPHAVDYDCGLHKAESGGNRNGKQLPPI
jgi:hypothetical protein